MDTGGASGQCIGGLTAAAAASPVAGVTPSPS